VALALLIAIWGVFLGVTLVRKRAEYRADSSIGAFQRQLQVLRRNSLAMERSGAASTRQMPDDGATPGFVPMHLRSINREAAFRSGPLDGAEERAALIEAQGGRQDPYFRHGACQRRRDVLMILASILVSTGLISIIPAARMALVLTAVAGVALVAYVALLVRLRAQAMEREMKLRYMPARVEAPVFADRRIIAR
jgi:hypothetical protein